MTNMYLFLYSAQTLLQYYVTKMDVHVCIFLTNTYTNLNKCIALVVGSYSLSMRQDRDNVHNVKHYRIHQLHNGWFYIHQSHYFSTLTQLVDYYSRKLNISPIPPSKDSPLHFNEDKNNIWMLKGREETLNFFRLQGLLLVRTVSWLNLAFFMTPTEL